MFGLVGNDAPRGEFDLTDYTTRLRGYGGALLSFKETDDFLFAVHRVVDVPGQQRRVRLKNPDAGVRNAITHGCINLEPAVYEELVKCCYRSKLL